MYMYTVYVTYVYMQHLLDEDRLYKYIMMITPIKEFPDEFMRLLESLNSVEWGSAVGGGVRGGAMKLQMRADKLCILGICYTIFSAGIGAVVDLRAAAYMLL